MSGSLSADALGLDLQAYAEQRAAARDRMIPLRRGRRLRLGDLVVVEFEQADSRQDRAEVPVEIGAAGGDEGHGRSLVP